MSSISCSNCASGPSDYYDNKINNLFRKADKDGDGKISASEFDALGQNLPGGAVAGGNFDPASLFKQVDKDGDGQLTKDEVSTFANQQKTQAQSALLNLQELFGGASNAHGHRAHHHHGNGSGDDGKNSSDPISQLLSALGNTDGSSNSTDSIFSSIDGNSDGSISKDELSGFLARYQQTASLA